MKKLLVLVMAMVLVAVAAGCSSTNESKAKDDEETAVNGEEETGEGEDVTEADSGEEEDLQTLLQQVEMTAKTTPEIEQVTFDFALKNSGNQAVNLDFSSGQQYEIIVKNESGEEVYRYSEGKSFTEALVSEEIQPGKELTFNTAWNYKTDGERVQPGPYTAEITLLPASLNKQTIEAKPFQVEKTFEIPSENQTFRNVQVEGENGQYTVTGQARVFEGSFMYNVEDGHKVLVPDTAVQASQGAPNWGDFEFEVEIPKDKLPENGTLTLMLYEESAKDGSVTNQTFVKLDTIQ